MEKRITKEVHIGNRVIGGGNPILIQSMTNTKTEDVAATVAQIQKHFGNVVTGVAQSNTAVCFFDRCSGNIKILRRKTAMWALLCLVGY